MRCAGTDPSGQATRVHCCLRGCVCVASSVAARQTLSPTTTSKTRLLQDGLPPLDILHVLGVALVLRPQPRQVGLQRRLVLRQGKQGSARQLDSNSADAPAGLAPPACSTGPCSSSCAAINGESWDAGSLKWLKGRPAEERHAMSWPGQPAARRITCLVAQLPPAHPHAQ